MGKESKKFILLIICCLIIGLVFLYQYVLKKDKEKNTISDHVTIEETLNSINTLYGVENYIKPEHIDLTSKDIVRKLSKEDVKKIIKKLSLNDETMKEINSISIKEKFVSRNEWTKILLIISKSIGIENACIKDDINVYVTHSDDEKIEKGQIVSDNGKYQYTYTKLNLDHNHICVLRRDSMIIFVTGFSDEPLQLKNALIVSTSKQKLTTSILGYQKTYSIKGLKEDLINTVADLEIDNNKITKLSIKRDSISGKVLAIDNEGIEIEGFGKVPFSEPFRLYNELTNFEETDISKLVVGQENVKFIVGDKKLCAAILQSSVNTQSIRVLIKSTGFKDLGHDNAYIGCNSGFTMSYYVKDENGENKEMTNQYAPGEEVGLDINNDIFNCGRIKITPNDTNEKLIIKSISRNGENPQYRGTIEVSKSNDKLIIINELPLEEYLYAVVPSEMPSSYGVEALKVQAVCARSYAISHLNDTKLSAYGAHVDDSTDYQVYNNTPETDVSIQAVKETNGQVLKYGDEIANTYFYATSCGCTTDSAIWGDDNLPYIQARLLTSSNDSIYLQDNATFSEFIKSNYASYDSGNPWYRWNISFSRNQLSKSINNNLGNIYQKNKERVLTLDADGTFKSKSITSVGEINNISVEKRGAGGIIEELVISGDKNTVKIIKQSNIRNLISPYGVNVNKCDGSVNDKMAALPSAFFTVEKQGDGNYVFYGGGYGHGAGMSQTAVKSMVQEQKTYDSILKFFFSNVEIQSIY